MKIFEMVYFAIQVVVVILVLFFTYYGIYSIYYAYVKKKDEREKYIVLKSTANAYTIIIIYSAIQMIVLMINNDIIKKIWIMLHFGFSNSAISYVTTALGVCLFVNKRKAGDV